MNPEDLGYVEELLGLWDVWYPSADGMIDQGYVERLELRLDGTYRWTPTPSWARTQGRWGVMFAADGAQTMRLYFEKRTPGAFRGNWIVIGYLRSGGRVELMLHWQRTRADAVVFDDRVLVARYVARNSRRRGLLEREKAWLPHPH